MADNWDNDSFNLPPISSRVGPFPGRAWLETWWNHRSHGELMIVDTEDSLVPLVLDNGIVTFAGEDHVTDYHSPLGSPEIPALTRLVDDLPSGTRLSLDSLPAESAEAVAEALRREGLSPVAAEHEAAAVLNLPATFDDYLTHIGKKERHELRRKRRRFERETGSSRVERWSGDEAVALFASLHRRSAGDKGEFMTDAMEAFFLDLHRNAGGVIDILLDGSDRPASAIFSFEDEEGFYLYNSAFEPDLMQLSPGNVMLSHLIERSIEQGLSVFDFLKGDETYKFRLGAVPRPLYVVTATIGGNG